MEVYFVLCTFIYFLYVDAILFQKFVFETTFESKTCQSTDLHETTTQVDVMRCAHKCSGHESCKSFFYSDDTDVCFECGTVYTQSSDAVASPSKSRYFFKQETNTNNDIGTTTPAPSQGPYVEAGCFPSKFGSIMTYYHGNSKTKCGENCGKSAKYVAFSMEGKKCYCYDEVQFLEATTTTDSLDTCTSPCPGQPSDMCGNEDQDVSNYHALPLDNSGGGEIGG